MQDAYEDSIDAVKISQPWVRRTFGKMEDGGIRGNIFLMTISTVGCAFFYLPYYAKQVGLLAVILLVALPALISYYSSYRLYYGFKHTKAKTYDECMKNVLGPRLGYFSNVVIFMHTFSAVVGAWVFSYKVLSNFVVCVSSVKESTLESLPARIAYFGTIMCVLFASSLSGKVDRLKFVSMFGIAIILYLVAVFAFQTSTYYDYYNSQGEIRIVNFELNWVFFEAYGICFFLYLNQYTIIPICNNIKQVTSKRISKVIARTTGFVFSLFLVVLFIGYFSLPNFEDMPNLKLFVLRPAIDLHRDKFITIGKLLFALYLIIGMLVKGHFFLIYFNQLLANTIALSRGERVEPMDAKLIDEQTARERKAQFTQQVMDGTMSANILNLDNGDVIIKETKSAPLIASAPPEANPLGKHKHLVNFVFLCFTALLTILIAEQLNKFLSISGGFIAIFEVIVFPLLMLRELDIKRGLMYKWERPAVYLASALLIVMGLTSAVVTLVRSL